jgi:hypothetical protein
MSTTRRLAAILAVDIRSWPFGDMPTVRVYVCLAHRVVSLLYTNYIAL